MSATTITATTGAHAAGAANVVVTNPDSQPATQSNGFTFNVLPSNDNFANRFPITGGGALTATGSNLGFTVEAGEPGDTLGGGDSRTAWWTWTAPCGFSVSSPNSFIDTIGSNFDTVLGVFTGSNLATLSLVAVDDDTGGGFGTSRVPNAGTLNIVAGTTFQIRVRPFSSATAFTGDITLHVTSPCAGPAITSIAPTFGPVAGGTGVTITGTGFIAGATVSIGGVAATGVSVVNSTTITATTGAHAAGAVNVVVSNPDTQTATLTNGFTYVAPPTVTAIAPVLGHSTGGTNVTITGTNFAGGATVSIGGVAGTNVNVLSATTITATTGAHAAGLVNVVVTNPTSQTGTLTNGFTYVGPPAPTSIAPTTGPTAGGTFVTITCALGCNVANANGITVTIGGVLAAGAQVVNATTVTAFASAHAAGTVNVVLTSFENDSGTLTNGFTFIDRTITSISPATGPTAGGNSVTITGANFVAGTTVSIGGVAATGVTVVNGTTITATAPAHAAGAVNVVLNFPDGQGSTLINGYTYINRTITAIAPAAGSTGGGTSITITGTNIVAGTTVTLGGVAATGVNVVNATTLTATTGAHAAGAVNVIATFPDGQVSTLTNGYTYNTAPAVTSIAPASGRTTGGTNVTITGTNFLAGATLTIGGLAATSVSVVNATTITATTPAHAAGAVDVVVTNTDTQTGTLPNGYTYVDRTITSIAPTSGRTAGGTSVTITGTNINTGTTVSIGGVAATSVNVVNATTLTATTGAHAQATVDVVVTFADGQTGTLTNAYTYITRTVTAIAPTSGRTAGGTAVTITGTNFPVDPTGGSLTIGGVAATNVVQVNLTTITATTGAHAAGAVDVVLTAPDGQTGTLTYTYVDRTVTAITPISGRTTGGTSVTITGTNMVAGTTVTIGGAAATNVLVTNATTLTAMTPAHAAGAVDVVVTFPDGQTGTLTNGYTYIDRTVTAIAPTSGPTAGGTPVTISGTNFVTPATVTIGGVAATGVIVVNPTTITATTGAHAAGAVDVVVTFPDGQTGTLALGYTYASRTVTAIAPTSGTIAGGTSVTITGTNLVAGTTVTIGGVAVTGLTVVNATTITATTGAHAAGLVDVVAAFPDGQSSTLTNGYRYLGPPPTVASISPVSGPTAGGTAVTITGTNFVAGATVALGGTAATSVVVTSGDTQVATLTNGYTYVAPPVPLSITPAFGLIAGGDSLTIGGTGFTAGATVTVGGVAATGVVVVNATTITAVTPAHAKGVVNIVVTNTDGQTGTLTGGFSFSNGNAPTLLNVTPSSGTSAGGTSVTITGNDFLVSATVSIGGNLATNVVVLSDTMITATTAAHGAGTVSIVVTNPDTKTATLANSFTYVDPPSGGGGGGGGPAVPPPPPPPPPVAPGAPTGLAGSLTGSTVGLSWNAPSTGSAPSTYVIEAGSFSGGSDLTVFSTGSVATALTVDNVAAGTYFVRVRAQSAAGLSGPSNEVVLTVIGGPAPPPPPPNAVPGRPTGLVATVNGSTVVFAWSAPTPAQGGIPTAYQIEAGSSVGLSNLASFSTGSTATSLSVGNVPAGTYYVRVRAINGAGASAPSNEVVLVVTTGGPAPPCGGPPPAPTGLGFIVNGSTVTVGWNDSPGATSYVLEVGSNPGASNLLVTDTGNNSNRLVATNVGRGSYFVRVRARSACGTSGVSNEVLIVVQ